MSRQRWIAAALGAVIASVAIMLTPDARLFPPVIAAPGFDNGRWACAMMDYVADHRGDGVCPVCGMRLELVRSGALSDEQRRRMGVETVGVRVGHARVVVYGYGTAHYDIRLNRMLTVRFNGRVEGVHPGAHDGALVGEGEDLVDIRSDEVGAAQRELAAAVADGNRPAIASLTQRFVGWNLTHVAKGLLAGGAASDLVTIRSPFFGRIEPSPFHPDGRAIAPLSIGLAVSSDQALLVIDPESMTLIIHVPEARSPFLRIGQRALIATDDGGELADLDARIGYIAPDILPEIRAREVRIFVRDPRHRIVGGALVSARFQAVLDADLHPADPDRPEQWGTFALLAKDAVLSTGVRNVAWRLRAHDQAFELAPLALGPRLEDDHGKDVYVVLAGVADGDLVAARGAFLIDSQAQLAGAPCLLFPDGAAAARTQ